MSNNRFTIGVSNEVDEWLESQYGDGKPHDSKSGAVAHHLEKARGLAESEYEFDELLGAVERVEELETKVERLENEKSMLIRDREERTDLVEYVDQERSLQQQRERRQSAPVWKRAKWWVLGAPNGEEETHG